MTRPFDPILDGEDISLEAGRMDETPAGDIAVVTGRAAARQSVIRELPASPGSLPRRPSWGAGLSSGVHKPVTRAEMARMTTAVRSRLDANPRISRTREVDVSRTEDGTVVSFRADTMDGVVVEDLIINSGVS